MIFDKEEKPFIAVIIGPFNENIMSDDIQIKCFHMNGTKPYELKYKFIP